MEQEQLLNIEDACFPFDRASQWWVRFDVALLSIAGNVLAWSFPSPPLVRILGATVPPALLLVYELTSRDFRKRCTQIAMNGEWHDAVVTAKRTTPRGPVYWITVAIEEAGQRYEQSRMVRSRIYYRFRIGQKVQVRRECRPSGKWVVLRETDEN